MSWSDWAVLSLVLVVAVYAYSQHQRAEDWKNQAIGWKNKAEHLEWKLEAGFSCSHHSHHRLLPR